MRNKLLNAFVIALILFQAFAPIGALAYTGTNQNDYQPGAVVTISGDNSDGAGFGANEAVDVAVSAPNGFAASCTATTDANGAWWCQVTLPADAADGSYSYVASSKTSTTTQSGGFTVTAPLTPTVEPTQAPTAEPTQAPPAEPTAVPTQQAPITPPFIQSDLGDYPPGALVTLTSGNWQPGESVHIIVNDSIGNSWVLTDDVIADASGAFIYHFNLPNWFVAQYHVYSYGPVSGVATTDFTDANPDSTSMSVSCSPNTVTINTPITCSATVVNTQSLPNSGFPQGSVKFSLLLGTGTFSSDTCSLVQIGSTASSSCSVTLTLTTVVATKVKGQYNSSPNKWNNNNEQFDLTPPACTAPSVSTNPVSQSIAYGANAIFTATGTGSPAPTIQWQVSTNSGVSFSDIGGETSTTLTINTPSVSQSGNQYRAVFTNTCAAGTATSTAATLTVSPRPVTITADAKSKAYGDADPALTYQITSGSLASGDSFTGSLTRVAGEAVGTYAIQQGTVALNNNYTLSYVGANLTIGKRAVEITADAKSKTYGDADPALTYQITSGSLAFSDTFSGALTRAAGENVGTYAIQQGTVALNNNYTLSYVGANLTIGKRAVEITADAKSKTYGDADPALTYQITSGSLAFSDTFSGALTRAAGENVGTYAIQQGTVALNNNYTLSYVGANLTIGKRAVEITADAKSKTYGDADPALTYQITSGSLAFSDTFSGALTRAAGENVGTYAIQQGTVALNNNYTLSYVGANLTIGKRAVEITADAKSKTYGDADPALTYQITSGSLAFSDTFSGALTRAAGENVGTYAIQQGTVALNNNYTLSYVGANLTIGKRAVEITADAKSKTYGDADPALTYQITSGSLAFSDTFSGALTRAAGENVGTYAIQQGTVALNNNYTLSYVGANLTIGKRAVEITADAKSKTYGDADPALTYQITSGSLAFSDTFSGALTRAAGENVGTYAIQQGTVALNNNYTLSYVGANLTIGKRAVEITADAKSKTYGDADPALTYQITSGSLAFSDTFSGALTRAAGENVGTYAIQQGTVALNNNYTLSYVGANLTIGKRAVEITADAKSKTYGDADPALTYQITSGSLAFSDTFSGALTRAAGENVGTYAIQQGTVALNNNYTLSYVGANLTIGKRAVEITADAKTKILGSADPALTYQITSGSLAFSDTFSGALTRAAGENVGTYAIQQGTVALNNNYDLTYVGANLTITYALAGTMCLGSAGHTILQPINAGGDSVFKQGSTVPAKFRVCDANGNSIGTAGVVSSFRLVKTVAGTVVQNIDEAVVSTTPDSAFRWSATDQQWIFNMNTKSLKANITYFYDITLNDGSHILFQFGLK